MKGFTLTELLVAASILGVLTAMGVPLYLGAHAKAKTARAVSDLRSLSVAAEMYRADRGEYPPHLERETCSEIPYHTRYAFFTTPVPYMHTLPGREIFVPDFPPNFTEPSQAAADTLYYTWTEFSSFACRASHPLYPYRHGHGYLIRSRGPDGLLEPNEVRNAHFEGEGRLAPDPFIHSPTNGLMSRGDIVRTKSPY